MTAPKDGGAAFPQQATGGETVREGMSLRDYFAARVLPAIIEHSMALEREGATGTWTPDVFAREAYQVADAMRARAALAAADGPGKDGG